MSELGDRQKRFADEYLIDFNAEQAAIRAGYSEKYARGNAHKLVANSGIGAYLKERMSEKDSELIATSDEVLQYLTAVMRRQKSEYVVVTLKRERTEYVPDKNGTMRKQTVKEEYAEKVEIPARLSDANKAAELLGKAHCLFTDKVDVKGEAKVVIVDDIENS